MKNFFWVFLLFFVGLLYLTKPALAEGYATCDLCGYCPPQANQPAVTPPSNWAECLGCLYPMATPDPDLKQTLQISADSGSAPTPYPGAQFTMLGCIKSNTNPLSIISEGPARSLADILLSTVLSIVGGIAFLYLLYGAFLLMTSQGDPERLNQGKKAVYGAITGLIFSLSTILIIRTIASGILKIPGIQ